MASARTVACTLLLFRALTAAEGNGQFEVGTSGGLLAKMPAGCDPSDAPHVVLDWGNMNGDKAPFQAWRATTDSVDFRFDAFPEGYQEGAAWGPSCPWPIRFICMVKTVPCRPKVTDFQQDGIGPGLGAQDCGWAQASTLTEGSQYCHVYMYNLESAGDMDGGIKYHAWCMACLGPNCTQSTEDNIYPKPQSFVMKSASDYNKVMAAMDPIGDRTTLKEDIHLSSGNVIKGYTMDDGCECRISRTVSAYKKSGKQYRITHRTQIPAFFPGIEFVLDDGLPFKTVESTEHHQHVHGCLQVVISCIALMLYIVWGLFGLQRYVRLLHETGLATIVGLFIGFFKIYVGGDREYIEFSFGTMCFVVLPVVIFAAGFNFKKKSLFKYGSYIITFGFIGTLLCFFGFYHMFKLAGKFPEGSFASSKDGVSFSWDVKTCLVLAAVLSCCDTVAPLTLINAATLPVLYAVVFGEAVINDVVGVLFNASVHHWLEAPGPLTLFFDVSGLLVCSLLFGLVFGVLISICYAYSEHLQHGVLQPFLLMLLMNYLCYALAELLELSAIFAIFVCALVSSHYAIHSLDHDAQHFAHEASELLAFLCEAGMFVYFGFASATYLSDTDRYPICIQAVLYCTAAIIIVRPLVLSLLTLALRAVKRQPLTVPFSTIFVVELCGCIRGTISYALILKHMPSFEYRSTQDQVLVSTVLLVVNITTVVFGCILPVAIKCLEPKPLMTGPGAIEVPAVDASFSASSTSAPDVEAERAAPQDPIAAAAQRIDSVDAARRANSVGALHRRSANPFADVDLAEEHHLSPPHQHHRKGFYHVMAHKWNHVDKHFLRPLLCKKEDADGHHAS